jgi:hypothetical protein
MEERTRQIEIDGVQYELHFSRRPFREGCEVTVLRSNDGTVMLRIAELGFGEQATIERVTAELRRITSSGAA